MPGIDRLFDCPEQGLAVHFNGKCAAGGGTYPLPKLWLHVDHAETQQHTSQPCEPVTAADGQSNRVEVRLSTTSIEVWMSDASADGVTFGLALVFTAELDLSFDNGHVYIGAQIPPNGTPATWLGGHDLDCGPPTTTRLVHFPLAHHRKRAASP